MRTTPTPGPWEFWPHNESRHPLHSHGVSAEGKLPCDVADVIRFDGQPGESEANARLIAASWSLFTAGIDAAIALDELMVRIGTPTASQKAAFESLTAAIRKARGE